MVSVLWVGALVCFLVLACVHCPVVGGGCGCVFGLGIKAFDEQTHCRVHVQHRVSVRHLLWWLPACPA